MTDRQIEQIAIRVADIVIQALEDKQQEWDKALVADLHESLPQQDKEQKQTKQEYEPHNDNRLQMIRTTKKNEDR